jgi:hypothetical protein
MLGILDENIAKITLLNSCFINFSVCSDGSIAKIMRHSIAISNTEQTLLKI